MTIQALIALLVSLPRRSPSVEGVDDSGIPAWEKHPAEQQMERRRAHDELRLWAQFPRSW